MSQRAFGFDIRQQDPSDQLARSTTRSIGCGRPASSRWTATGSGSSWLSSAAPGPGGSLAPCLVRPRSWHRVRGERPCRWRYRR
jgi:hypothetical protein